ncbi:MAG: tetratricopeptide repeat protein [Planctomycetes bacterium]|nr:tetratricopeptide repeat protein [Planctomycetota bacterium]
MTEPGHGGRGPHTGPAGVSPGVADQRAWLRLDQIEPVPNWPPTEQPIIALSDRGADRLKQALTLLAEQRYTEASLQAEKALRTDPQSFEVHRALARMHMATGSTTRAQLHARRAVERNPHDAVSRYLLGRLAMDVGDSQIAMQEFRCALRALEGNSSPDTAALVHVHLGEFLEAEGFYTAAAHQYDAYRALVMDPSFDPSGSVELTTLIQLIGPGASAQRSRVYEKLGDFAAAAGALDELVVSTDSDVETRRRHAILLVRAGEVERAKSIARQLVGSGEASASLLEELHAIIDDPQGLIGELRLLADKHPANIELTLALAEALVNDRQTEAAIDMLQLSLEGGHADTAVYWRLADLLLDAARWRGALAVLSSAAGRYPQADSHVRDRVERLAGEPDALHELLDAHDLADDYERQPSPARDYVTGLLADRIGNPDLAHVLWQRCLAGAPEFIQARLELIEAALGTYRWDEALALCIEAPEGDANDARLKWMSGRAAEGLDDFDRAIAFYNESIRLNRTDTRPRHSLAELYVGTDRPALAQQQYQALLSVNSLDQTAREALIRLYLSFGERQAARRELETLVRLLASPSRIARCRAQMELNPRLPGALERYRQTIESALDPANPDYRSIYEIAWSYLNEQRYEEARDSLERVLELQPDHVGAARRLTWAQAGLLDYEARISGLRSLLLRFPNRLRLWHAMANALLDEQAYEEVVTSAKMILQRDNLSEKDRQGFRSYLVDALRATDQTDEIVALALEWHRRDPDNDDLRQTLIFESLMADRIDDALDVARNEYLRHPADQAARSELIGAMLVAKRYGQASQYVVQWLEADPDNQHALRSLIRVLLEADQFDDAVELAKANVGRVRDPLPYQRALVDIYREAKRYDEAEDLLSKQLRAIDRRNNDHELERHRSQQRLARLLMSAERYDRAQERLSGWIAELGTSGLRYDFLTLLSICHAERGHSRQAIETLELAHEIDPRNPGACNDLGYMLADAGLRLEEAEALIRYAVARSPRNAAFLDSLGWVMYKKGDFEAADRWLQKATHTGDEVDPVVLDHLADTYWRLGRTAEAIETWQQARDLTEDGETANVRALRDSLETKLDSVGQGGVPPVADMVGPTPSEAM